MPRRRRARCANASLSARRGAGDHARAHHLADLDRRECRRRRRRRARPASRRLCSCAAVLERVKRRAVSDAQSGGAVEVERRPGIGTTCRAAHHDLLARRAVADVAEHPIARASRALTPAPTLSTTPAHSARRRERHRRLDLVFAGDDQRVEKIQRRRLHAHAPTSPGPGVDRECRRGRGRRGRRIWCRAVLSCEAIRLWMAEQREGPLVSIAGSPGPCRC